MNLKYKNYDYSDQSQLKNRLYKLIFDNSKMQSPKDLAKKVFETGLILSNNKIRTQKEPKQLDAIYKDIQEQLDSKDDKIYLNNLTSAYISAYCKIFNCSSSYLLGERDITSNDPNMFNAIKYTGLSQRAIESIRDISFWNGYEVEKDSKHLSEMLSTFNLKEIISCLSRYEDEYNTIIKNKLDELKNLNEKMSTFKKQDVERVTHYKVDYEPYTVKDSNGKERIEYREIIISELPDNAHEIYNTMNDLDNKSYEYQFTKEEFEFKRYKLQKLFGDLIDEIYPLNE